MGLNIFALTNKNSLFRILMDEEMKAQALQQQKEKAQAPYKDIEQMLKDVIDGPDWDDDWE